MHHTRPAAVSGSFYPDDARALRAAVDACLRQARPDDNHAVAPKLLVVPHAGYVYSGPVAASAYALLAPWRDRIRRVVLLGPVHRVPLQGLALPVAGSFETPLGRVPVDEGALAALQGLPQVTASDRPHAAEHALEVQLPFLQAVLGEGWTLVPLAVGDATPGQVDEVLERLWGGDETLLVVSSDLSHYLPYEQAQERDWHTVQRILSCVDDLHGDEACGAAPLNGALRAARRHQLVPRLLDLRNSADTAGGAAARVVGYAALAFEAVPAFKGRERALGHAVLSMARSEIAQALGVDAPTPVLHPRLHDRAACFVTLHDARGQLRGCVGQLEATQALGEDVRRHALGAAFGDSRFQPLTAAEWPGLDIEVSVLGPLQPLPLAATLDDAAALLQPGVDGVVLAWQGRRATFLPQVWQQLPERRDFLRALLRKAGLSPDFWDPGIALWRYGVTVYQERRDEGTH